MKQLSYHSKLIIILSNSYFRTSITHKNIPVEIREQLGIFDTTIRLSVGLESTADIIQDLEQALKKAFEDYEIPS